MDMKLGKKQIFLFALALALFFLAACGGGEGRDGRNPDSPNSDDFIATYAFVPTYFQLETEHVHVGSTVHGDSVYAFFSPWPMPDADTDLETWEPTPKIVIERLATEGTEPKRLEIPMPGASMIDVAGISVTEEGHYALLYTDTVWDMMTSSVSLYYAIFDGEGNKLSSREVEGVAPQDGSWFRIIQTVFLGDQIVLMKQCMSPGGSGLYVLDESRTLAGRLPADFPQSLAQTADGRVFVLEMGSIREMHLDTVTWGESFQISLPSSDGLLPAAPEDDFDLIIDDGIHLMGYNLTTGAQTLLLNWIDSGVVTDWGHQVHFFEDGRIAVLTGGMQQASEITVLSRVLRSELPTREILTLGGFSLSGDVRNQVVAFNRRSQTHQIQVTDYRMYSTNEDPMGGITRLRSELATGTGPDIVVGDPRILASAIERGFLADLYPHLDADPELHRSDFFQNVLGAMEAGDGTLPLVANRFSIQTMIGMAEQVAHIDAWTLGAMLELLEQTADADMEYILGEWLTGESFLATILMFGDDFINWSERQVDLENEAFLHLLEIVRRLPQSQHFGDGSGRVVFTTHTAFERMQRGEQLLDMTHLWRPMDIQMFTAAVGEIIALGVPTPEGGAHLVNIHDGLGINAASPHQEEAWNFIRLFLLPDALGDDFFAELPLRVDLYEAIVAEAMRPEFFTDEDGEVHEVSRGVIGFSSGLMIPIYAMSEEEAQALRTIVESADLMGRFDETVMEMVSEELLPFLAGDRNAADTARILQNRLQTYMNEQR